MTYKTVETRQKEDRARRRARWIVALSAAATAALIWVPMGGFVAYPLVLLSTFAHEMGHGIAAELIGGDFQSFVMFADGSGVARILSSGGRLEAAWIAAGGLVGPAVLAAILFGACAREQWAQVILSAMGVVAIASCLLVVRNGFGLFFVGAVGVVCLGLGLKTSPRVAQAAIAFLATQMALSVFSRGDYLFTPVANTATGSRPSDVALMAQALVLPYWFWGMVCAAISVAVLAGGLALFFAATKPRA